MAGLFGYLAAGAAGGLGGGLIERAKALREERHAENDFQRKMKLLGVETDDRREEIRLRDELSQDRDKTRRDFELELNQAGDATALERLNLQNKQALERLDRDIAAADRRGSRRDKQALRREKLRLENNRSLLDDRIRRERGLGQERDRRSDERSKREQDRADRRAFETRKAADKRVGRLVTGEGGRQFGITGEGKAIDTGVTSPLTTKGGKDPKGVNTVKVLEDGRTTRVIFNDGSHKDIGPADVGPGGMTWQDAKDAATAEAEDQEGFFFDTLENFPQDRGNMQAFVNRRAAEIFQGIGGGGTSVSAPTGAAGGAQGQELPFAEAKRRELSGELPEGARFRNEEGVLLEKRTDGRFEPVKP